MHARHVMTRPVVTVPADATVYAAAEILLGSRISAAPVVDADGTMIGMVSEADLMNRPEIGTVPARSWLQRLLADDDTLARSYVRSHSHRVADVMTRDVVSATERTDLRDIAALMDRRHVKRIPILRDGKVVGIVSRSNLLQGLLSRQPQPSGGFVCNETLRTRILGELAKQPWSHVDGTNIVVDKGVVHLWGYVGSRAEKNALRVAAENIAGVSRVVDHVVVMPVATSGL